MKPHQNAHDAVCAALSALCGLEAQVNDQAFRLALRVGLEGEHQQAAHALMRCAADLHGAVEAAAPLLSDAVPVWREARRRLGSLERLLGCVRHSAHELVVIVACDVIKRLRQVNTAGDAYRVLDERRLCRADLEALWVRVEEEQEATARQDGGRAEANPGDAPAKGGDERVLRLLESMGPEQARIVSVAGDKSKTVEHRMMEIAAIDRAYLGKDSEGWAALLGCSSAAIRKTAFWAQIQSEPDAAYRDAVEMTRPL